MGVRSKGDPSVPYNDVFGETVQPAPAAASALSVSGGNVDGRVDGDWTYHTFTSDGTLTIENAGTQSMEILMVGGGGAGGVANDNGSDGGGGAGAGNVNTYTGYTLANLGDGDFTITVGAGAAAFPGPPSPGSTVQSSQVGGDSIITKVGPSETLTAKGGGGGGHGPLGGPLGPHGNGGSGGGGGGGGGAADPHKGAAITNTPQPLLPNGGTITQRGNEGTRGNNPPYYGGGGGGAGGVGVAGNVSTNRGRGGAAVQIPGFSAPEIGVPALNPVSGYYGGGGPGGSGGPGNNPGTSAPPNGGTPGSPASNGPRTGGSGLANSGSGGGGASGAPAPPNPGSPSGAGGPGIVVIRYQA